MIEIKHIEFLWGIIDDIDFDALEAKCDNARYALGQEQELVKALEAENERLCGELVAWKMKLCQPTDALEGE